MRIADIVVNNEDVNMVFGAFLDIKREKTPRDPADIPPKAVFLPSFVSKLHVENLHLKMVDNGWIDEKFGFQDMGVNLNSVERLFDIIKEGAG